MKRGEDRAQWRARSTAEYRPCSAVDEHRLTMMMKRYRLYLLLPMLSNLYSPAVLIWRIKSIMTSYVCTYIRHYLDRLLTQLHSLCNKCIELILLVRRTSLIHKYLLPILRYVTAVCDAIVNYFQTIFYRSLYYFFKFFVKIWYLCGLVPFINQGFYAIHYFVYIKRILW